MVGQVMHNISTWRWIRSSNGWTSSGPSCIGSISPCHVAEIAMWQLHRSPGHAPRAPRCQWCKGKSWQERYKHHTFSNYNNHNNHNNSFLVRMLWVISRFSGVPLSFFFWKGVLAIALLCCWLTTLWLSNVLGTCRLEVANLTTSSWCPSPCPFCTQQLYGWNGPRSQQPPGDEFFGWLFVESSYLDVSENSGTPKSSILIGFSIINHPFWGTPYFWKHPFGITKKHRVVA